MSEHGSLPAPVAKLVGTVLKDQYQVIKLLGSGGMGAVFLGKHVKLGRVVAIKFLFMQLENLANPTDFESRFRREAQLASQLTHPNIAQVFDFDVAEGMPYMVMEYVEGSDLSELIEKERPVPFLRALTILRELAMALGEAARMRVVHRDIKPGNIRISSYEIGGPIRLKVLDFGLAKQVDTDEKNPLTKQGTVMGTPSYMAPEQISPEAVQMIGRGSGPVVTQSAPRIDERADLYSAGIIFYELLTGQVPFKGSQFEVINSHLFRPPPPLPSDLPAGVRRLCMRLLAKQPDERFRSAADLIDAIDRLIKTGGDPQGLRWPWLGLLMPVLGLAAIIRWLAFGQVPVQRMDMNGPDLAETIDLSLPADLTVLRDLSYVADQARPTYKAPKKPETKHPGKDLVKAPMVPATPPLNTLTPVPKPDGRGKYETEEDIPITPRSK